MRTFALLSFVCLYVGAAWIDDPKLREIAENRVKFTESKPIGNTTVPRYSVNLDLEPADRYVIFLSDNMRENRNVICPQVDSHRFATILSKKCPRYSAGKFF